MFGGFAVIRRQAANDKAGRASSGYASRLCVSTPGLPGRSLGRHRSALRHHGGGRNSDDQCTGHWARSRIVRFRREFQDCFRKARTAAVGRVLPIGDSRLQTFEPSDAPRSSRVRWTGDKALHRSQLKQFTRFFVAAE